MFSPRNSMPQMGPRGFYGTPSQFPGGAARGGNSGGGFLNKLLSGFSKKGAVNPTNMGQGWNNPGFMSGMSGPANAMQRGINPGNLVQGGGNASNLMQGLTNPSTLQGLTNPANLTSMLGNVQKALNTAERVMPMVQQYGPLVKNIPSMLKLYKELNSSDSDDAEANDDVEISDDEKTEDVEREVPASKEKEKSTAAVKTRSGDSVPKLYI